MGLHFIPSDTKIDFVGLSKISYLFSLALFIAGIASLLLKGGPNYGIDFAGGALVQIQFNQATGDEEVKKALEPSGLPGLVVQKFGEDGRGYLLRISGQHDIDSLQIRNSVTQAVNENLLSLEYEIQRLEIVGPKVGDDLRSKAIEALFYATLFIAVYLSGRFEQRWSAALLTAAILGGGLYTLGLFGLSRSMLVLAALILTLLFCWKFKLAFAMGALISIIHDLVISVGIFSILDKEMDLTIIAALLTVVGYSLNDTIVVFDRIRENLRNNPKKDKLGAVINRSINQTISRTVLTSLTTLLVVLTLLFLGGGIIHDFALLLATGILIGTYSSIFVASPVLLFFEKNIFIQVAREKDEMAKEAVRRRNRGLPQV
jgi:preprotein translocase subunit SecF